MMLELEIEKFVNEKETLRSISSSFFLLFILVFVCLPSRPLFYSQAQMRVPPLHPLFHLHVLFSYIDVAKDPNVPATAIL